MGEALIGAHKIPLEKKGNWSVCVEEVSATSAYLVGILLTQSVENAHFYLPLACIRRMVLENFNGHYLVGSLLPALGHLTKCASAEKLQHFVVVIRRLENFMLHQLVVALRVGGGGFRSCRRHGYG